MELFVYTLWNNGTLDHTIFTNKLSSTPFCSCTVMNTEWFCTFFVVYWFETSFSFQWVGSDSTLWPLLPLRGWQWQSTMALGACNFVCFLLLFECTSMANWGRLTWWRCPFFCEPFWVNSKPRIWSVCQVVSLGLDPLWWAKKCYGFPRKFEILYLLRYHVWDVYLSKYKSTSLLHKKNH